MPRRMCTLSVLYVKHDQTNKQCLMIDCLKSSCSVKSRACASLVAQSLVPMILLHFECEKLLLKCCTGRAYRDAQDRLL